MKVVIGRFSCDCCVIWLQSGPTLSASVAGRDGRFCRGGDEGRRAGGQQSFFPPAGLSWQPTCDAIPAANYACSEQSRKLQLFWHDDWLRCWRMSMGCFKISQADVFDAYWMVELFSSISFYCMLTHMQIWSSFLCTSKPNLTKIYVLEYAGKSLDY